MPILSVIPNALLVSVNRFLRINEHASLDVESFAVHVLPPACYHCGRRITLNLSPLSIGPMPEKRRKVGTGKSARSESVRSRKKKPRTEQRAPAPIELGRNVGRTLLLVLVAASPWYYGSATWGAQILCTLTSVLILLLAILFAPKVGRGNVLYRGLTILILFGLFQTLPLPTGIWDWLSPNARIEAKIDALAEEMPVSANSSPLLETEPTIERIASPSTISIAPRQTQATLAVLASSLAILWSSVMLMNSKKWQIRLLLVLSVSGVANGVYGILQSMSIAPPMPGVEALHFSTFVNRNSAPQFLSIAIGSCFALLIWWIQSKESSVSKKFDVHYPAQNIIASFRRRLETLVSELDVRSVICLVAVVLLFTAVLASTSRGGVLACGLACLIMTVRLLGDFRSGKIGLALLGCGVLAILTLSAIGLRSSTGRRLSTLNEELHQFSNVRFDLWHSILSHSEFWLTGSGHGTFHLAVLTCDFPFRTGWFMHAENLYVEAMTTFGLVSVIAFAGLLGFLFCLMNQTKDQRVMHIAALFPVCAIAAQCMVDFSLILPGLFIPIAALVGTLEHEAKDLPRWYVLPGWEKWLSISLIGAAICIGIAPMHDFVLAEQLALQQDNAITYDSAFEVARQEQLRFGKFVFQSAPWPEEFEESQRQTLSRPDVCLPLMRQHEDAVPALDQLADAAPKALEYLRETAEPMTKTIEQSPLDWRASWGLLRADLNVLSQGERGRNLARLYLSASHKPELLCDVGNHLLWSGEKELGKRFWQKAVRKNPSLAKKAIQLVPFVLKSEELLSLLPESPFIQIDAAFSVKQKGALESAEAMLQLIDLESAMEQSSSSQQWQKAGKLAESQQNFEAAADCLLKAATMDAANADLRWRASKALLRVNRLADAKREIERALRRSNAKDLIATREQILKAMEQAEEAAQ